MFLAVRCTITGRFRVCHNKRITRNKVFRDYAERGKNTMGWYLVSSYTWYAMREVNCLTLSQILMTDLGLSWRNHQYGREHSGVSSKTNPTYWRTWCHSSSSTPGAYTSSSSPRICSIHRDKVNSNIITSQKIANCRVGTPYKVGCIG